MLSRLKQTFETLAADRALVKFLVYVLVEKIPGMETLGILRTQVSSIFCNKLNLNEKILKKYIYVVHYH